MRGKIIRGVGGFYYVHTGPGQVYECRPRGIFRKQGIKPLPGDDVEISITDPTDMEGSIDEIYERHSSLIRPAVANVDQALLIFAAASPAPNANLLDHFLLHMKTNGLPVIIAFNKTDLSDPGLYREAYEAAGYRVLLLSAEKNEGLSQLLEVLDQRTTTVAGPSGVGKSSIINLLQPHRVMETGEVSRKIARGRHTTRHSELIYIKEDTYIMDTPGFTSLMLPKGMEGRDIEEAYVEFAPYRGACRFNGCSHTHEPDCAVKEALEAGRLSALRYETYCQLLKELG